MSIQEQNNGQPLTLAEYVSRYDPFEPDKIGPYIPEDGAVVRHTIACLYRRGEWVGSMHRAGHLSADDLRESEFVKNDFERDLTLDRVEVGIIHCCYGSGEIERDALEDEMTLVCEGALQSGCSAPEQRHTILRGELELPPASPLTERGMSRFFTAAAKLAEEHGMEVRGISGNKLQIYRNGHWAFDISESGGGSMSMQEYRPDLAAQGMTDSVSLPDSGHPFIDALHRLRDEIPEVLYPNDYRSAKQEQPAQISGMEMTM